ncbi:MAG: tRNA pseudouridine(55) synthase TruB [Clostridiales bacterium]|nr:tRNA pseudouridine(55) synthase TruB [Clostridiales bacterium]
MNGIININKPLGMTSHDVVGRLRRILGIKKIGHTGTLDPDASGVLPMCIGRATKTADMLTAQNKQYIAEVTLGSATTTLDASGEVTETSEVNVDECDIQSVVTEFVGDIMQIPPMYSAIKIDGKRLYELAREGVEVERKPRPVTIEKIEILGIDLENKKFSMKVDCSKGTYIRTLCDDIGRRLGCLAHMSALIRTRSGRFCIDDAYTLDEVEKMAGEGDMSFLVPIDKVFEELPKLILSSRRAKLMCNGVRISAQGIIDGEAYRVYDESGSFLTISEAENGQLKILKTFYQTS